MNTISALDSPLFGGSFSTPQMRDVFSVERYLDHCVEVEVALAKAQARLGIIPEDAAGKISRAAENCRFDMEVLSRETENVGYPILPLVEQLSEQAGEAGQYLHWGATTQDIMDSATILQMRAALEIIGDGLAANIDALGRLARDYRDVPMAGRTHLQHALPVTFGYKAAVWLSSLQRHRERLAQLLPRLLVVEFSGASGTLASLGQDGLAVQRALATELDLGVPEITWHSVRDNLVEAINLLAMIGGSLAKIAFDVSIMMTTELGEVSEPYAHHRGASSTMPQKQNPVSCELIIASSKILRQHSGLMLDAMVHDFERATGPWHLEWMAIPESFAHCASALSQAEFMLSGLQVFPDNMKRNLDHSGGLIVAEAVMMTLAPELGRVVAHDLVYAGCRSAIEHGTTLYEELCKEAKIIDILGDERLGKLTDPVNYLGSAQAMVDQVLADD